MRTNHSAATLGDLLCRLQAGKEGVRPQKDLRHPFRRVARSAGHGAYCIRRELQQESPYAHKNVRLHLAKIAQYVKH